MSAEKTIGAYKKEQETSYAAGAYGTLELLRTRPDIVRAVYIHPGYTDEGGMAELCRRLSVPVVAGDRAFRRINQKENTYVLALFEKYQSALLPEKPHVVLVNPVDMGNLGSIIRTMAGFHLLDLAVIQPSADVFHPKTIRASMGALFHLRIELFSSFADYRSRFPEHRCYPFMLDGEPMGDVLAHGGPAPRFSLIFGNEACGLPREFVSAGRPVRIPQSPLVDSLNLSVAAGIGLYAFTSACHKN